MQRPKRLFGADRNIEEGGTLQIPDTGSRMDEGIFEELEGAGNTETHLDREPVAGRSFPAIDTHRSGTRNAEPPLAPESLSRLGVLRRVLSQLAAADAAELPLDRMPTTRNNGGFPGAMAAWSGGRGLPLPSQLKSGFPPRVARGRLTAVPMLVS